MVRSWIAHDTSVYVSSVLSCSTGTIICLIIKFKSCFNYNQCIAVGMGQIRNVLLETDLVQSAP